MTAKYKMQYTQSISTCDLWSVVCTTCIFSQFRHQSVSSTVSWGKSSWVACVGDATAATR